jgi:hypothetical protein
MFQKKTVFWGLVVLFLAGGVILGHTQVSTGDYSQPVLSLREFGSPALPQADKQRVWRSTPQTKVLTMGDGGETTFFGPLRAEADRHGRLLVYDRGDGRIQRFSSDGKFEVAFGRGKGQGPEEFQAITDFKVTEQGDLWITDPVNGRITVFNETGEVLRIIKTPRPVYRLGPVEPEQAIVMFPNGSQTFGVLELEGSSAGAGKVFGDFLQEQARNSILLDGWLVATQSDSFVFVPDRLGFLAGYHTDGSPEFLAEIIGSVEIPKIVRNKGMTWVEKGAPRSALGVSANKGEIFVLSVLEWSALKLKGVLDAYNSENGRYLYSVELPERCGSVVITGEHLYTIGETTISKWERTF